MHCFLKRMPWFMGVGGLMRAFGWLVVHLVLYHADACERELTPLNLPGKDFAAEFRSTCILLFFLKDL